MLPSSFAFVDVETTGCSPGHDRIIEVGVLRVDDGTVSRTFSSLINPGCYLPPEITVLTGIHAEDLEHAPAFTELAAELRQLLDGAVFVAHNARFDYAFIKSEFSRMTETFSARTLCTVKLSRRLFPEEHRHNLDSIIERFGFSCDSRHRALSDAAVLWDFYGLVRERFGDETLLSAIGELTKTAALPPGLPPDTVDRLPESDGVYIFYGASGVPLYVGKSVNVRDRVLSHFYAYAQSGTESEIFRDVASVEAMPTEGELGALLLESELVKKLQPLLNRQLRARQQPVALVRSPGTGGYDTAQSRLLSEVGLDELPLVLAVYPTKQHMKRKLAETVRTHRLCPKLLGLEHSDGPCFGSQVGLCDGACTDRELPARYNMRFTEAFSKTKIRPWPFPGPIAVNEGICMHIVDRWCYLGKTDNQDGFVSGATLPEAAFDYDTYKILSGYLLRKAKNRQIRHLRYPSENP
jgi:DNA polymerase-3 subunit epsilon